MQAMLLTRDTIITIWDEELGERRTCAVLFVHQSPASGRHLYAYDLTDHEAHVFPLDEQMMFGDEKHMITYADGTTTHHSIAEDRQLLDQLDEANESLHRKHGILSQAFTQADLCSLMPGDHIHALWWGGLTEYRMEVLAVFSGKWKSAGIMKGCPFTISALLLDCGDPDISPIIKKFPVCWVTSIKKKNSHASRYPALPKYPSVPDGIDTDIFWNRGELLGEWVNWSLAIGHPWPSNRMGCLPCGLAADHMFANKWLSQLRTVVRQEVDRAPNHQSRIKALLEHCVSMSLGDLQATTVNRINSAKGAQDLSALIELQQQQEKQLQALDAKIIRKAAAEMKVEAREGGSWIVKALLISRVRCGCLNGWWAGG